jgi:Ca-activated chloride channel homolog
MIQNSFYSYAILFIGCIIVLLWWRYWRSFWGQKFPNPLLQKYSYTPPFLCIYWSIHIIIFTLLAWIWLNLSLKKEVTQEVREGKTILISLDISKSMKTDDIFPSRIDKAKEVIDIFLREKIEHKIGYTIFAGRTFLLSPPTYDHEGIRTLVKNTTTDTIDQSEPDTSWTNLGDALIMGAEMLGKSWTGEKVIILATDGRANMWIDPLIALEAIKLQNIKVYTVAIGTISWSVLSYLENGVRNYFYDPKGNKILADIDESMLKKIASESWWRYYHALDSETLEAIFDEINTVVSDNSRETRKIINISLSSYFLIGIWFLFTLQLILGKWLTRRYKFL